MRPAFYVLAPGGWRDYANILHPPYTLWHLSYVVLGASLVSHPDYRLLGWTVLAFFLALGLAAHALDELRGRPLRTAIPASVLWCLGIGGTAAASGIGVAVGVAATHWLIPFIAAGALLVFAYNLEWGPCHHDLVFAFAWGAFPVLTSYLVQAGTISAGSILVALAAAALSFLQRLLSTRVRYLRRTVLGATGQLVDLSGRQSTISREWLVEDHEAALLLLAVVMPSLALGLILK